MGFQKADRSARAALHMAARSEAPCVTDDPAGVVRLLEESSPAETDAYIHRQLGTLLRQPEPRRQELLDTLVSWLRCMGNQRRMARELHLHYNTVSYRAPAAMDAAGGRSSRSDEAIGIGNGPVSVPVQAHIKE